MTIEFIVRSRSFDTCKKAMRILVDKKLKMMRKQRTRNYEVFTYNEWMRLVNDFLALAEQCRISPTKDFEHYPRLATEYAKELINYIYKDTNQSVVDAYINSYVNNFDLMEYLND